MNIIINNNLITIYLLSTCVLDQGICKTTQMYTFME